LTGEKNGSIIISMDYFLFTVEYDTKRERERENEKERNYKTTRRTCLLVDPVTLVGRVYNNWIGKLLIIWDIGHIDVQSAIAHTLRDTIREESFQWRSRVAHKQRSSGHVSLDVRIWVGLSLQLIMSFT
jgi:hypothetical protein